MKKTGKPTPVRQLGRTLRPRNCYVQYGERVYRVCFHGTRAILIGYVAKGEGKERFVQIEGRLGRKILARVEQPVVEVQL